MRFRLRIGRYWWIAPDWPDVLGKWTTKRDRATLVDFKYARACIRDWKQWDARAELELEQ